MEGGEELDLEEESPHQCSGGCGLWSTLLSCCCPPPPLPISCWDGLQCGPLLHHKRKITFLRVKTFIAQDWCNDGRWVPLPGSSLFSYSDEPQRSPYQKFHHPSEFQRRQASPEELLRLHDISGLKRFAANWARLVLALIGSSRPWTLQEESLRYGQHSYAGFPFSWICSRNVHRHLGFDKTLGFPGEGPTLVLTLFGLLLSVWTYALGLHSPLSFSVCTLLGLPFAVLQLPDFVLGASSGLKSGLGCCGPPSLVGFLAAMPWSVGAMEHADVFLDPRDQGDEVRPQGA